MVDCSFLCQDCHGALEPPLHPRSHRIHSDLQWRAKARRAARQDRTLVSSPEPLKTITGSVTQDTASTADSLRHSVPRTYLHTTFQATSELIHMPDKRTITAAAYNARGAEASQRSLFPASLVCTFSKHQHSMQSTVIVSTRCTVERDGPQASPQLCQRHTTLPFRVSPRQMSVGELSSPLQSLCPAWLPFSIASCQ